MSGYIIERDLGYREGYDAGVEAGRVIANQGYQDGLANNPLEKIVQWNIDRNIQDEPVEDKNVMYCFVEELFEYLGVPNKECKKLAAKYSTYMIEEALAYGYKATMGKKIVKKIDALSDITVFATGFKLRLGYNPAECINETIKEISSRTGSMDDSGKWKKDAIQLNKYGADYSKCLR